MTKPLIIIGSSEIARVAFEYFTYDSDRKVVAFAVEQAYITDPEFQGIPVVPYETLTASHPPEEYDAFVAIGSGQLNRLRARFFNEMKEKGYQLASYVSSQAFVWHDVVIGENGFILENNVLQSGVRIGKDVTLWSGNHIGHRSAIGDHVFIASHVVVSGLCTIGDFGFVGVNASVAEEVVIAADNFVGMGTAVARSTEPDQLLSGNPAEVAKVGAKRFCRARTTS